MKIRKLFFWSLCLLGGLFASHVGAQPARHYILPASKTRADIHPARFIVRFKEETSVPGARVLHSASEVSPASLLQKYPVKQVKAIGSQAHSPAAARQRPSRFLSSLYEVELKEGDVLSVINELLEYHNVLYAEPVFMEQLLVVPNDPDAAATNSKQASYLGAIKAYDAWDITTGDSTLVIGISDTGVDYNHEDLKANLAYNHNDPDDGNDNDGNGFVDDYRGWDFADADNNPLAESSNHGTAVAGVSSARTNNKKGMAGTGFKTKFLPLKVFTSGNNSSFGAYESIIYAVDNGVDVLNLSWGSIDTYTQAAQDIINYAVIEKDVVVVAAAGNINKELNYYPASYDNVLSIASSNTTGSKAGYATYSYHVDMMAPGVAVYSTQNNNGYKASDGSSFATPMVAGAAALLRAHFPHYSAIQIMEQLRTTTFPLENVATNALYSGMIGSGMMNMSKALTDSLGPSVRIINDSLYTQAGQRAYYGDTINFDLKATNWLKPAFGVKITFEALSEHATVVKPLLTEPLLHSFDTISHHFSVILSDSMPPSTRVVIKANMEASGYKDTQHLLFTTEPETAITNSANLSLTIGSKGGLSYSRDSLKGGVGIWYKDLQMATHAGFLIGTGATNLADNAVKSFRNSIVEKDFKTKKHLKFYSGTIADNYYENAFTAPINENQSVLVEQKTLSWEDTATEDFIITEYRLSNLSPNILSNLHAGIFSNWEIVNNLQNKTKWLDSHRLGYTYEDSSGYYGGIALLSEHTPTFYPVDLGSFNGNTSEVGTEITDDMKFAWLSSKLLKTSAGNEGKGNNTAQVNGVNIGDLAGHSSEKIAFVWVAAQSLDGLIRAVEQARAMYNKLKKTPRNEFTFYACENSPFKVTLPESNQYTFYGSPDTGTKPLFKGNGYLTDTIKGPIVLYASRTTSNYTSDIFSVRVNLESMKADFSASADTVLLEGGDNTIVQFKSLNEAATGWSWDLGNDTQSTLQAPQAKYNNPGEFTITLTATNRNGCSGNYSRQLLVVREAPLPEIDPVITICRSTSATIKARNATRLRVYADSLSRNMLFEGHEYTINNVLESTSFYVSNADSLFESRRARVNIVVNAPKPLFQHLPDTTTFSPTILLANETVNAVSFLWLINDKSIATSTHYSLPIGEQKEVTASLIATNDLGCTSTFSKKITIGKSGEPVIKNSHVCRGKSFTLRPGNGKIFIFYNSQNVPIHKGKSYKIMEVTDTTTIIIKGIDNYLESLPIEVKVFPYLLKAGIVATPKKLILAHERTAAFTSQAQGAISWKWQVNDHAIDISQHLILGFDSAGTYKVTHVVASKEGCTDSSTLHYEVLRVTSLSPNLPFFSIYPNPASETLMVELESTPAGQADISICNLSGQQLLHYTSDQAQIELPVFFLPSGLYTVRVTEGGKMWQQKFLKE